MVSNQSVPSLIEAEIEQADRMVGLEIFTGYSVIFIVFGSNLEMNGSPKSEYQTLPSFTIMSCGSVVGRARSYSVMITRVDWPFARGMVLSEYSQLEIALRLMVARYSANLRYCFRRAGAAPDH